MYFFYNSWLLFVFSYNLQQIRMIEIKISSRGFCLEEIQFWDMLPIISHRECTCRYLKSIQNDICLRIQEGKKEIQLFPLIISWIVLEHNISVSLTEFSISQCKWSLKIRGCLNFQTCEEVIATFFLLCRTQFRLR